MNSRRLFVTHCLFALLPPTRAFGLKRALLRWCGAKIGTNVRVASSARFCLTGDLSIGSDTWVGHGVLVVGGDAPVTIGENVDIGPRVVIVTGSPRTNHLVGPGCRSGDFFANHDRGRCLAGGIGDHSWGCNHRAPERCGRRGASEQERAGCRGRRWSACPSVEVDRSGKQAVLTRRSYVIALIPLVAVAMRLASTPTADLSYLIIATYALLGRAQAIQALALSWLFSMLSPGIAADATLASMGRYSVLAAAALSTLLRSNVLRREPHVSLPVLATFLLGCLLVVHSTLFSAVVEVSVLKAISWTLAATTTLAAWTGMTAVEREVLSRQIFGGLVALLLLSLPLIGMELGYLRNGTGFQGILAHPQAFGPAMALLGAWAGGQVFSEKRPAWRLLFVFGGCLVMVVLSEARTAGISLLLGVILAGVITPALSRQSVRSHLPGLRSPRVYLLLGISVMVAVLVGSALPQSSRPIPCQEVRHRQFGSCIRGLAWRPSRADDCEHSEAALERHRLWYRFTSGGNDRGARPMAWLADWRSY